MLFDNFIEEDIDKLKFFDLENLEKSMANSRSLMRLRR